MGQITIWQPLGFGGSGSINVPETMLEELIAMGIELDRNTEHTTEELLPKVLQILETDTEGFAGNITDTYNPDYGFFGIGEQVPVNEVTTVTSAIRVKEAFIQVKGVGSNTLTFHGPSWTEYARTNNDEAGENRYLKLRYVPPEGGIMTLPMLKAAIDELTFEGNGETQVIGDLTLSITTKSGSTISATGSANFQIQYESTWYLVGLMYPTFGDAEESGKTWGELTVFDKSLVKNPSTTS